MGVDAFRGLVAPFLIESLELEGRVVESPRAARLLDSVRSLGLVGIALLPGPLRRPLGVSRPLVGPRDYAGAKVGVRFGRVAQDSLTALGATPEGYRSGSLAGLDGAELDVATMNRNGYDAPGAKLTANVVLWARPETVVIGRRAFERLDPAQQQILRRAGREAIAPVLAFLRKEEDAALATICNRGTVSLVSAPSSAIAGLRAETQRVSEELDRDPATRALIGEIRRLRAQHAGTETVSCTAAEAPASALEGRWEANVTRAAMLAHGASQAEVSTYSGRGTLEIGHGRWSFRNDQGTVTGTYSVVADSIRMTMIACTANPCAPGARTDYTWSVYRDTLSLEERPGASFWPALVAEPRRRVG